MHEDKLDPDLSNQIGLLIQTMYTNKRDMHGSRNFRQRGGQGPPDRKKLLTFFLVLNLEGVQCYILRKTTLFHGSRGDPL